MSWLKDTIRVVLTFGALFLGPSCVLEKAILIDVESTLESNQNYPIAVDLVRVYDKALVEKVAAMSAQEWFANREQLRLDYPQGTGFVLSQWEWVPDSPFSVKVDFDEDARSAFIFANYFSPGTHRATVDPDCQGLLLQLGEESFTVEYQAGSSPPCL